MIRPGQHVTVVDHPHHTGRTGSVRWSFDGDPDGWWDVILDDGTVVALLAAEMSPR